MLTRTDCNAQLIQNHSHIVGVNALNIKREDRAFILGSAVNTQALNRREQLGCVCCQALLILLNSLQVKCLEIVYRLTKTNSTDIVGCTSLELQRQRGLGCVLE